MLLSIWTLSKQRESAFQIPITMIAVVLVVVVVVLVVDFILGMICLA